MARSWKERVTKLANARGGLERLAADLGVSFFTVMRWKNGTHQPSKMAQILISKIEKEKVKK